MALMNCPECDSEVSDQADDCPECGYPINGENTDPSSFGEKADDVGWGEQASDGSEDTQETTSGSTAGQAAYDKEDEEEILRMHPSMFRESPFLFVLYLLLPVVVLGFIPARSMYADQLPAFLTSIPWYVLLILAAAATYPIFSWWIEVLSRTLIITNKKTRLRRGLLSRDVNEVYHEHVRNVKINQNIIQRLTDVGEVNISSAGQSGVEITFRGVHNPERVNEIINDHM